VGICIFIRIPYAESIYADEYIIEQTGRIIKYGCNLMGPLTMDSMLRMNHIIPLTQDFAHRTHNHLVIHQQLIWKLSDGSIRIEDNVFAREFTRHPLLGKSYSTLLRMINGTVGGNYCALDGTNMWANYERFQFLNLKTSLSPEERTELIFYTFIQTLPIDEKNILLARFNKYNG
jgi:hypothetical protein